MLFRIFGPWGMRFAPEGDGGGAGGGEGTGEGAGSGAGDQAAGGDAAAGAGAGSGSGHPAPPAGGGAPPPADWRGLLPADIRGHKTWENVKAKDAHEALGIIGKRYVEAESLIGRSIQLPAANAKPDDVAKWREANRGKLEAAGVIGKIPSAPGEYELAAPTDLPGLPELNDTRLAFYKDAFHKAGLTQEQAQAILTAHAREIHQGLRLMDEESQKAIDAIEERWGTELFDRRWALANRAIEKLVPAVGLELAEVKKYLDTTRKGNDPILFQILAAVGEAIDEDTGMDGLPTGLKTPAEAKARADEILADKKHPYHDRNHPRYREAVAEYESLLKLAYGTERVTPGR